MKKITSKDLKFIIQGSLSMVGLVIAIGVVIAMLWYSGKWLWGFMFGV